MATVSFIIPTFNAEHYLRRAVRSILDQPIPAVEVIIVDDGSTDQTLDVARRFGDSRVTVISDGAPNRGPSVARNRGLAVARGDYIVFLDADDWIEPAYVQENARTAEAADADVIFSSWKRIDANGKLLDVIQAPVGDGDLFLHLCRTNLAAIQAVMVRRELALAVGGFDPALRQHEDWEFWLRICAKATRIRCIDQVLSTVQRTPRSNSSDSTGMGWSYCEVHRRSALLAEQLRGRGAEFHDLYLSVNSGYWRRLLKSRAWREILGSFRNPIRRRLAWTFIAHAIGKRLTRWTGSATPAVAPSEGGK